MALSRFILPTIGFSVLVLGFLGMSAASKLAEIDPGDTVRPDTAPFVETLTAARAEQRFAITAPGRLRSRQATALVGEVAGIVVYMHPDFVLGGRFEAGDVLFRIDPTDYETAVENAKANLKAQEANLLRAELAFKRRSELVKNEVVSEAANDDAIANLASARAGLDQAKAQLRQAARNLERTEIKAPFPALVTEDNVSLGTYVAPGQALGVIIDTSLGEMIASLTPADAQSLAALVKESEVAGQKLTVTVRPNEGSVSTKSLTGVIDRFVPQVDQTSRTAAVVAIFENAFGAQNAGAIFADDYMTLEITAPAKRTVWRMPTDSIRRGSYVWGIKDSHLTQIQVEVLENDANGSLVTSSADLTGVAILATLLSEEVEGLRVRPLSTKVSTRTASEGADR